MLRNGTMLCNIQLVYVSLEFYTRQSAEATIFDLLIAQNIQRRIEDSPAVGKGMPTVGSHPSGCR